VTPRKIAASLGSLVSEGRSARSHRSSRAVGELSLIGIEKSQLTHRRLCESKSHVSDSHRSFFFAVFEAKRPSPPPFPSMNSMPARCKARRDRGAGTHTGRAQEKQRRPEAVRCHPDVQDAGSTSAQQSVGRAWNIRCATGCRSRAFWGSRSKTAFRTPRRFGSAYRSAEIEAKLRASGYNSRIHRRGRRNHPLSLAHVQVNHAKSRIRARIER
jgi:hypothetical protein